LPKETQPITGRGIGYKLFIMGLSPDMSTKTMAGVYRLLKEAREERIIPWEWIVDETRELEGIVGWDDAEVFVDAMGRGYRRNFWNQQPVRLVVWSEKGTVRGVLRPVLDQYGVQFLAVHGFNSATVVHDICQADDGRPLIIIYVGDFDCSGMNMSEEDLPKRFEKYEGAHFIDLRRLTLKLEHCKRDDGTEILPGFPASDKGPDERGRGDPRYKWFVQNYGDRCWELDALDPRELRSMLEQAIRAEIDWVEWNRCAEVEQAERESMRTMIDAWNNAKNGWADPAI
jgi:hypothetical protein